MTDSALCPECLEIECECVKTTKKGKKPANEPIDRAAEIKQELEQLEEEIQRLEDRANRLADELDELTGAVASEDDAFNPYDWHSNNTAIEYDRWMKAPKEGPWGGGTMKKTKEGWTWTAEERY